MKSNLHTCLNEEPLRTPKILSQMAQNVALQPYTQVSTLNEITQHTAHLKTDAVYSFVPGSSSPKVTTVGVLFSGGQAPGGHNVISGLFDALAENNGSGRLIGFIGGPSGLIENDYCELTAGIIAGYRNTGGFDLIASGRTKIESEAQFEKCLRTAKEHRLDVLVIIGGDDSNTNAALLAEYFQKHKQGTTVIGVPKTIDGDLKNDWVEVSFGFDTATRVYSELIGNIARDALSAQKYWHFIKLMGRSASHVTLECALQTQPNICIVAEEVAAKRQSLQDIVEQMSEVIVHRHTNGKNFGIALLPEGLIEFIPEMRALIAEINELLAAGTAPEELATKLRAQSLFQSIPLAIREQLLLDRDPHGNVQVSRIETDKLIASLVEARLTEEHPEIPFSYHCHFLGYEGRASFPTRFDATYCYNLGRTAFLAAAQHLNGYMVAIAHLARPVEQWQPLALPIPCLMQLEQRHGALKPVIEKALVALDGPVFRYFIRHRSQWALDNSYVYPGPIQFFGPTELVHPCSKSLQLESDIDTPSSL